MKEEKENLDKDLENLKISFKKIYENNAKDIEKEKENLRKKYEEK